MLFTGAIFDCDDTLVDSMDMWYSVVPELMEAHGLEPDKEFMYETESLNLEEQSALLQERYNVCGSAEETFNELMDLVKYHYAHDIKVVDGCFEFLDELVAAGIPRVIASSTPSDALEILLGATGLDVYFDRAFSTSDVGRGKDFPDVYLAALDYLGTDKASTWVFEDAPFGINTAHEEGFPVACIVHENREHDTEWMRSRSNLMSNLYTDISLDKIEALA